VTGRRILVTGAAGFIGSNFVRYWDEEHPTDHVVVIDLLTHAGDRRNLDDLDVRLVVGDIGDVELVERVLEEEAIDLVVNFAAETHNSLAVLDPGRFFRTNVLGTQTLLEAGRRKGIERFHHVSTCEVYGDMSLDANEAFTEESPYRPRTPYNASKAAADHAVRAYFETFGLPVTITNCSNNYGPRQFPEKVVPLFLTNALDDRELPLYASTQNRREWLHVDDHNRTIELVLTNALDDRELPLYASTQNRREWLHVDDHNRAIELVLERGTLGETYNVGSGIERSIEEIADLVLELTGKPEALKSIVPDRPGHDRRYLLDSSKLRRQLGWKPDVDFEEGLRRTVDWYRENRSWWEPLKERAPVPEATAWR